MKKTITVYIAIALVTIFICKPDINAEVLVNTEKGYVAQVPAKLKKGKKLPVLIALPGYKMPAKLAADSWLSSTNKKGFLLIALDVDYDKIHSDEGFDILLNRIESAIKDFSSDFSIDEERTYIAGISAGGMMAMSLTLRYPERFRATGVVSGARLFPIEIEYLANARNRNFYLAHGDQDKIVPLGEFEDARNKLDINGAIVEKHIYKNAGHDLPSGVYPAIVEWFARQ